MPTSYLISIWKGKISLWCVCLVKIFQSTNFKNRVSSTPAISDRIIFILIWFFFQIFSKNVIVSYIKRINHISLFSLLTQHLICSSFRDTSWFPFRNRCYLDLHYSWYIISSRVVVWLITMLLFVMTEYIFITHNLQSGGHFPHEKIAVESIHLHEKHVFSHTVYMYPFCLWSVYIYVYIIPLCNYASFLCMYRKFPLCKCHRFFLEYFKKICDTLPATCEYSSGS